jgi:hypothetical protein
MSKLPKKLFPAALASTLTQKVSSIFVKKWNIDKYFSDGFQFETDAHWLLKAPKWDLKFLLEPFSNSCAQDNPVRSPYRVHFDKFPSVKKIYTSTATDASD